jgi:hypothetical protein
MLSLGKEKRVEAFGERLEVILKELDTRDLKEIGTPLLLKVAQKYSEHLRHEYVPLKLQAKESFDIHSLNLDGRKFWEG